MYDVVTFGEAMLRLSPPDQERLEQAVRFDVRVGGSELNVAVALSRLGQQVTFVTRLPNNLLGRMVANKAREHGVDTSHVVWDDQGRLGVYYVEFGAAPRPTKVVYDRKGSTMSLAQPGEIDWATIFRGATIFHVSGITPALSDTAAEVVREALLAAKTVGCRTSLDVNYRSQLWTREQARTCLAKLMASVDALILSHWDASTIFHIEEDDPRDVAARTAERFDLQVVALTLRDDLGLRYNRWTAVAFADGAFYEDVTYEVEIVDRIGSGDAFTAGFLYGYLSRDAEYGLRYGNALCALKHSTPGDLSWSTREEIEILVGGAQQDHILR